MPRWGQRESCAHRGPQGHSWASPFRGNGSISRVGNKVEGPLGSKGGQWYPRAGFAVTWITRFRSRGAVCEVMKGGAAPEAQVIELPELHTALFFLGREGGSLLIQFLA